jgi:Undecaprenyl-phosphate galactose phosphotransferase WbaP
MNARLPTPLRALPRWLNAAGSMARLRTTKALLLGVDVLMLALAAVVALVIAVQNAGAPGVSEWLATQNNQRYFVWLAVAGLGLLLFLGRFQHYTDRKPFWTELKEVITTVLWLAMIDIALLSITRWNASRLWWLLVWLLALALIPLGRVLLRKALTRAGLWQRPTLLIGNGANAAEAIQAMASEPQMGFEVIGCVDAAHIWRHNLNDEAALARSPDKSLAHLHRLRSHAGLQVVIALEYEETELREQWLRQLARWKVQDVCVIPAMRGIPLFGTDISSFFSHEIALLRLRNNLRRWPARLTKRLFDLVVALLLLVALSPLLAWLALQIRRDGGPAVFAHRRVGLNGRTFRCLKVRSMVVNADQRLTELLASDPALRAEWARDHKLKNDPRLNHVGDFLRRTSLDELPQLLNVLRGEMSLVGPRPVVTEELEKYSDDTDYYLMVRPGITGLWQVSGRNDVGYEKRVYLDTWYVKNWSLWYDIAILFKTVRVVWRREGAY